MEVIHAPADLHAEKEPPASIGQEAGWDSSRYGFGGEERKSLNRTPVVQPVA